MPWFEQQGAIHSALRGLMPTSDEEMEELACLPENHYCSECHTPNPRWCSISLGVFVCLNCAGVLRGFGPVTKMRSVTLDNWTPEQVAVFRRIGNQRANSIWEGKLPKEKKPTPSAAPDERTAFIAAKYIDWQFAIPDPEGAVTGPWREAIKQSPPQVVIFPLRRFILAQVSHYVPASRLEGVGSSPAPTHSETEACCSIMVCCTRSASTLYLAAAIEKFSRLPCSDRRTGLWCAKTHAARPVDVRSARDRPHLLTGNAAVGPPNSLGCVLLSPK
ncbi:putative zinc finger protein [Paratrimastix pyriformis]|uniref:Zinc finger protein n=1 Tax=Paratrimastix pyriformis TaxID=342808 RepID=A0ABQ8UUI6_9EUKA|nr:putative zinc finger protein [Paratrimastix pyriformis]